MADTIETYSPANKRIHLFYTIYGALFAILLAALAYRQIFLFDKYSRMGERQTQRRIITPGARGDIYDRNGKLLVGNKPVFSACVDMDRIKQEISDEYSRLRRENKKRPAPLTYAEMKNLSRKTVLENYMAQINACLGTGYKVDMEYFNKHFLRTLLPLPLVGNLTEREHALLSERLKVDSAVEILTDTARYYPYRDAAAQTLGYVLQDFEEIQDDIPGEGLRTFAFKGKIGVTGVEKAFEKVLAGKTGAKIWMVDLDSYRFKDIESVSPQKGADLDLSIDIDLQLVADAALNNRKGALVALDVRTGEILAIASHPAYDLNRLSSDYRKAYPEILETGGLLNRATQGVYPPGSTFKIASAIAGLESGAITLDSTSECAGSFTIAGRTFNCNARHGHGKVNLVDAIALSCNVFFYEHALAMGIDQLSATAKRMGLDSSTGVEFGDAVRATIVPNPAYKAKYQSVFGGWSKGDTIITSIGQGFTQQTPIQMACFMASVARGETRTKASILHDPTRVTDMPYHGAGKLDLSPEQYKAIVDGMENAVSRGTCRSAWINGVRVAAKSGTAEVHPGGRSLALAWMIAFAPVEDPQIAIAVIIEGEEPGEVGGGRTAGPVVKSLFSKYFEARR